MGFMVQCLHNDWYPMPKGYKDYVSCLDNYPEEQLTELREFLNKKFKEYFDKNKESLEFDDLKNNEVEELDYSVGELFYGYIESGSDACPIIYFRDDIEHEDKLYQFLGEFFHSIYYEFVEKLDELNIARKFCIMESSERIFYKTKEELDPSELGDEGVLEMCLRDGNMEFIGESD